MSEIRRLVVVVGLDGRNDRRNQFFFAHLYAELADERRVVVLDDRGWASSMGIAASEPGTDAQRAELDIWARQTAADLEFTARTVVGPDEPREGMSYQKGEDHYWAYLVRLLADRGVATDAATLRGLAVDVELSERVRARLGGAS